MPRTRVPPGPGALLRGFRGLGPGVWRGRGSGGAQGGGSPARAPPGASAAVSSFYPQQAGNLALLSYFTDEEGEVLRVRQLPKGTQVTRDLGQNPGVRTPGPLPAIPSTCVCGQVQAGQGATWGEGGSAPFPLSPWGFPLGGLRRALLAPGGMLIMPRPSPRPPRHTARGPVTEGASEKGQPSSLCGALGWRLPLGVRVGEEGGGAANRQGPVSCLA